MFIFEIYKNADPDHIALVGDRTLTYGEMNQQISRYRNVLYKKGVRQGDRIAILVREGKFGGFRSNFQHWVYSPSV